MPPPLPTEPATPAAPAPAPAPTPAPAEAEPALPGPDPPALTEPEPAVAEPALAPALLEPALPPVSEWLGIGSDEQPETSGRERRRSAGATLSMLGNIASPWIRSTVEQRQPCSLSRTRADSIATASRLHRPTPRADSIANARCPAANASRIHREREPALPRMRADRPLFWTEVSTIRGLAPSWIWGARWAVVRRRAGVQHSGCGRNAQIHAQRVCVGTLVHAVARTAFVPVNASHSSGTRMNHKLQRAGFRIVRVVRVVRVVASARRSCSARSSPPLRSSEPRSNERRPTPPGGVRPCIAVHARLRAWGRARASIAHSAERAQVWRSRWVLELTRLRVKRRAGRPKDLAALPLLEATLAENTKKG